MTLRHEVEPREVLLIKLTALRAEYSPDTRSNGSLAQSIASRVTDDLSGGIYIFELLQNADDAIATTVSIHLLTDEVNARHYLIFGHNGNRFSVKDIDGICDIASVKRDKLSDIDATGDKGIGFKALFELSPCVIIKSGDIAFRFQSDYPEWQGREHEMPWQVTPIITNINDPDEFPASCAPHCQDDVAVVLKIENAAAADDIKATLVNLLANHRIIVFLKNITEIRFGDECLSKATTAVPNFPSEVTAVTTTFSSPDTEPTVFHWYQYTVTPAISATLHAQLATAKNVPEKYKEAETVTVKVMVLQQNGRLLPLSHDDSTLFHTLPTNINLGFRCLSNVPLLLNGQRKAFRKDAAGRAWNSEAMANVYIAQLRFLNFLARLPNVNYWQDVARLVVSPQGAALADLDNSMVYSAFAQTLGQVPLLRNVVGNNFLTVPQAYFDHNLFVSKLGTSALQSITMSTEIIEAEHLCHLPEGLRPRQYSLDDLVYFIKHQDFQAIIVDPFNSRQFILFLHATRGLLDPRYGLATHQLILTTMKRLVCASEVYFPNESLKYVTGGIPLVAQVHAILAGSLEDTTRAHCVGVLQALGVKELSLQKLVDCGNTQRENHIAFVQCLFRAFTAERLKKDDITTIGEHIQLLTTNGNLVPLKSMYPCNQLEPLVKLEAYFPTQVAFLNYAKYDPDMSQLAAWQRFLSRLGMESILSPTNVEPMIKAANAEAPYYLVAFTRLLFDLFQNADKIKDSDFIIKHFPKLRIVTARGEKKEIKDVYLADRYQPTIPLQTMAPSLDFVSDAYLDDGVEPAIVQQWRQFFTYLGIRESVRVSYSAEPLSHATLRAKGQMASEYVAELTQHQRSSQFLPKHPEFGFSPGRADTMRYPEQHTICGFFDFDHIDAIIRSPYFWHVLASVPLDVEQSTKYKTLYTSRSDIPSNLIFYVRYAIQQQYQRLPRDLYAPSLNEKLHAALPAAQVATVCAALSDDWQRHYGFKQFISAQDAFAILRSILERTAIAAKISSADKALLTALYEEIIRSAENDPTAWRDEATLAQFAELPKLNRQEQFIPAANLLCATTLSLETTGIDEHLLWLPRPIARNSQLRTTLLSVLAVRPLAMSDLILTETELSESFVLPLLAEKFNLVILLEAKHRDLILEDQEGLIPLVKQCLRRQRALQILQAERLIFNFEDRFQIELANRYEAKVHCLYHTVFTDLAIGLLEVAKLLKHALKLSLDHETLWKVLLSSREVLLAPSMQMGITEADLQLVQNTADGIEVAGEISDDEDQDEVQLATQAQSLHVSPSSADEELASASMDENNGEDPAPVTATLTSSQKHYGSIAGSSAASATYLPSASADKKRLNMNLLTKIKRHKTKDSNRIASPAPARPVLPHLKMQRDSYQSTLDNFIEIKAIKQRNKDVGDIAEQATYDYFFEQAKAKYGDAHVSEVEPGVFEVRLNTYHERFVWMNRAGKESYEQYDFARFITEDGVKRRELVDTKAELEGEKFNMSDREVTKAMRPCSPDPATDVCPHGACRYGLFHLKMQRVGSDYKMEDGIYEEDFDPEQHQDEASQTWHFPSRFGGAPASKK